MSLKEYIRAAFGTMPRAIRRRFVLAVLALAAVSVLDLVALTLVVTVTTLGTQGAGSADSQGLSQLPDWQQEALSWVGVSSLETATALLGGMIVVLFVGKGLLASRLLRRILRSLARHEAAMTTALMDKLMRAPLAFHLQRRDFQLITDTTVGVESLVMKVVAPTILIAAETVLVIMLGIGLLILAPAVAVGSLVYFAIVLLVLHRWIGRRAAAAGKVDAETTTAGMMTIQWALGGYREVVTRGVSGYFVDHLQDIRSRGAGSRAEVAYLGLLPRYLLESALIVGMALAFAVQLPFTGFSGAMSGLALFAVAGFRLLPSLQRVQGSAATIKAGQPFGEHTLGLMREVDEALADPPGGRLEGSSAGETDRAPALLREGITLESVTFTYPGGDKPALEGATAQFRQGQMTALVGASGSGKSTLVDLLLGLLVPDEGCVRVDGKPLGDVREQWRRQVGYVPQDPYLMPRSIRSNVALGLRREFIDDELVWKALRRASIHDVIDRLPGGLDYELGDAGAGVSGGQRQRLGIARALYAEPQVLIFDEATSSLDVETEAEITTTLAGLAGLTKIVVAHRLSTVRDADNVLFMRGGRITATGTFDEVRRDVPDFARQVHLSGLSPGSATT
jgi:ABC-type multidrug transport system fused ATPase/permease subunit